MNTNLHLHSRYSDGTLWPQEIAEAGATLGLELMALTDHDNMAGVSEFAATCAGLGLSSLPACEIDCIVPEIGYRSEILVYFPGGTYKATSALLAGVLAARSERVARLTAAAANYFDRPGLAFDKLVARKTAGRENIDPILLSFNMVDVFYYLKSEGAVEESLGYRDFLRAYIDSGKITGSKMAKPSLEAIVAAAKSDGGVLVLPHPGHQFNDDPGRIAGEEKRLVRLLSFFKDSGFSGVELYWYGEKRASEAINDTVRRVALDLGLMLTYGSDCHGPGSGKYTIDKYSGNFAGFAEAMVLNL
jgi:hypothetical protein